MSRGITTLLLTRYQPDRPGGGSALRNWQNISALAAMGTVDVVSIADRSEGRAVPGIREWTPFSQADLRSTRAIGERARARLWPLRRVAHPGVDAYFSQRVSDFLSRRMQERRYDLAVIEELFLSSYIEPLQRAGCRVIFDAHNVESVLRADVSSARPRRPQGLTGRIRQHVLTKRWWRTEGHAIRTADAVWACSRQDADAMAQIYGRRERVTVVPNAVDVDAYRRPEAADVRDDWKALPVTLVFPGSFSYYPNEDAALRMVNDVLPSLRSRGHDARVLLVGRDPTPRMAALAQGDPAIEITGAVDTVLPYFERPGIVTLPIALGGGTRLKILEAFAVGRPVISTTKGAEGIDAVDGEHLLIRDTPAAIADAAISLWHQPERRHEICTRALDLVRSRYSWPVVARQIDASVREILPVPAASGIPVMSRSA